MAFFRFSTWRARIENNYTTFSPDILGFDFGGHPGTPGMCLGCFLMVFSDSWGRKNLFLPPTQKIFIFTPCEGP